MKKSGRSFGSILFGLLFFIFLRVDSWLCSLPAWLTLILHFTVGLSIWWFWGTLIVWIAVGILRYLLILFGRWGASSEEPYKENRNPYSVKSSGHQMKNEDLSHSTPPESVSGGKEEEDDVPNVKDVSEVSTNAPGTPGNSLH